MEALVLFLVPGLNAAAAKAVLDCWFTGSVFADWRARAQDARDGGGWALTRFVGGALSCRFCLSYHVTLLLAILSLAVLPSAWLAPAVWLASQAGAWCLPAATPEAPDDSTDDGPPAPQDGV